ncbi:vegetative cell wall protein precursor [Mycobacterium kansasii]|nr:vegetative cell wall protein precursor [Mycobacterium kansasii]
MAIFGRRSARQRLRRATEESLTIPAFSSPPDCTPWVIGGLWPAELSPNNAETAALAAYLKADLDRIVSSANDELRTLRSAVMLDSARRAAEAAVIDEARARAVRRVESTVRQLRGQPVPPVVPRPSVTADSGGTDLERTRVLPAIKDEQPGAAGDPASTRVLPVIADATGEEQPAAHEKEQVQQAAPPEAEIAVAKSVTPARGVAAPESDDERLQRLLTFVARQEPRLNWAVGQRADGLTVLVTDLAHGWVPPGVMLPEGVQLLEPQRRSGGVAKLIGTTARLATYRPGDILGWTSDFTSTTPSPKPRELPASDNLASELSGATRWRDGLPRIVHLLAQAAVAGGVGEDEIDLLRVHLDTARHEVLAQYPNVDPALLLNCMLLAATESAVIGDPVSANYHFAWFRELSR